jgi:hypothetical protein
MPFPFLSASPSASPEEVWTAAFEKLSQKIICSFLRPETHQHALPFALTGARYLPARLPGYHGNLLAHTIQRLRAATEETCAEC